MTDANVVLGRLGAAGLLGRPDERSTEAAARPPSAALAERLGLCRCSRRPRASSPSSTPTWPTPSARARCRRASIRATSRWSPSAAPARCTGPRWRPSSAFGEVIVPPHPGHHLGRWGCSRPTSNTTRSAPRSSQQGSVDLARLNRDFVAMEDGTGGPVRRRRRRREERRASPAPPIVRYAGQGYELRIPIAEGALRRRTPWPRLFERLPRARTSVEYGHRLRGQPGRDRQRARDRRRRHAEARRHRRRRRGRRCRGREPNGSRGLPHRPMRPRASRDRFLRARRPAGRATRSPARRSITPARRHHRGAARRHGRPSTAPAISIIQLGGPSMSTQPRRHASIRSPPPSSTARSRPSRSRWATS